MLAAIRTVVAEKPVTTYPPNRRFATALCPRDFVSMVVDVRGRRLFELVDGRTVKALETSLAHIQGAENVLLLRNGHSLDFWKELDVQRFLDAQPALREVYLAKEALHRVYRTRGIDRAKGALDKLLGRLAASTLPELATLRRTLAKWRDELLAYFDTGLTNAITEGFNLKAKLVKRRAFGYRPSGTTASGSQTRVPLNESGSAHHRVRRAESRSGTRDSNPRHPAWEAGTLPTELVPRATPS